MIKRNKREIPSTIRTLSNTKNINYIQNQAWNILNIYSQVNQKKINLKDSETQNIVRYPLSPSNSSFMNRIGQIPLRHQQENFHTRQVPQQIYAKKIAQINCYFNIFSSENMVVELRALLKCIKTQVFDGKQVIMHQSCFLISALETSSLVTDDLSTFLQVNGNGLLKSSTSLLSPSFLLHSSFFLFLFQGGN